MHVFWCVYLCKPSLTINLGYFTILQRNYSYFVGIDLFLLLWLVLPRNECIYILLLDEDLAHSVASGIWVNIFVPFFLVSVFNLRFLAGLCKLFWNCDSVSSNIKIKAWSDQIHVKFTFSNIWLINKRGLVMSYLDSFIVNASKY
jgi:hypothetical protein